MTSYAESYAPLAARDPANHMHLGRSGYEVFWRRAPTINFSICFLVLYCSFNGWPWLGMALSAFSTLTLLAVALVEFMQM